MRQGIRGDRDGGSTKDQARARLVWLVIVALLTVAAGGNHTCGLRTDGTAEWGDRSEAIPPPNGVRFTRP